MGSEVACRAKDVALNGSIRLSVDSVTSGTTARLQNRAVGMHGSRVARRCRNFRKKGWFMAGPVVKCFTNVYNMAFATFQAGKEACLETEIC